MRPPESGTWPQAPSIESDVVDVVWQSTARLFLSRASTSTDHSRWRCQDFEPTWLLHTQNSRRSVVDVLAVDADVDMRYTTKLRLCQDLIEFGSLRIQFVAVSQHSDSSDMCIINFYLLTYLLTYEGVSSDWRTRTVDLRVISEKPRLSITEIRSTVYRIDKVGLNRKVISHVYRTIHFLTSFQVPVT